ncbi:energy transducer TonB [Mariniflexile sp.]|uniref:energy transducer TonB n=1 Tax=Mariniflexile sp. TaxID=1979402 RepID=UPI00356841C0
MENYIQNIDLINGYLNKTLSETEIKGFEDRLEKDEYFKELYEYHIIFLEGLKRQTLKSEIIKGKRRYVRNKWLRYLGISIASIIISIVIYSSLKTSDVVKMDSSPKDIHHLNTVLDTVISNTVSPKERLKKTLKLKVEEVFSEQKVVLDKEKEEVVIPKKTPQKFTINTSEDTIITCNEGTKLVIKGNSFVDQNNKNVTGKVDLEITEFYKLSDMLLANLTTKSDDELLETAGMLFMEAKKDDLDLKLKLNTDIEISFPTANKKEGMQLFSGAWVNGNINWKLQKELEEKVVTPEEADVEVPFAVIEQVPVFPGCENLSNSEAKACTTTAINSFVQTNFNTEIAKNLGLTGRQRINVIFKINQNGDVLGVRSRATDPELEDEASRVISSLPKMQPGKQRGRAVTVPYSLPIIFDVNGETQLIANFKGDNRQRKLILDSINNKRFEDRLAGTNPKAISASEVNHYIRRTSNLGWINCDKFNRSGQRIKYKLKIKNELGVEINMVFKSINSLIPSFKTGNVFDFGLVPKNEDVVLIAIKKENGKLFMDIIETTITENPDIAFSFKEVNFKELKAQLKKLDSLFN